MHTSHWASKRLCQHRDINCKSQKHEVKHEHCKRLWKGEMHLNIVDCNFCLDWVVSEGLNHMALEGQILWHDNLWWRIFNIRLSFDTSAGNVACPAGPYKNCNVDADTQNFKQIKLLFCARLHKVWKLVLMFGSTTIHTCIQKVPSQVYRATLKTHISAGMEGVVKIDQVMLHMWMSHVLCTSNIGATRLRKSRVFLFY